MEYTVKRNKKRKRLLLTVEITGEVVVKAGYFVSDKTIEKFVAQNIGWIEQQKEKLNNRYHYRRIVTKQEQKQMQKEALPVMKEITEKYSAIMRLCPKNVKITSAEKRWGSCSSNKTVCFSYRVLFLSQRCKEYLAVHELAHLAQMNHSGKFYSIVEKYMPDYKEIEKELSGYYIHLA